MTTNRIRTRLQAAERAHEKAHPAPVTVSVIWTSAEELPPPDDGTLYVFWPDEADDDPQN